MKTTVLCELRNLTEEAAEIIDGIMAAFSSAVRYSFKRILEGRKILDIEKLVQLKYSLNSRYSKDAVEQARQMVLSQRELLIIQRDNWQCKVKQAEEALIKAKSERKIQGLKSKLEKRRRRLAYYQKHMDDGTLPPVIFGGRRNFIDRCKGNITHEQWQEMRDNRFSSRGDRSKKGNLNIRIIKDGDNNYLRISTLDNRSWITVPIYIPQKLSKKTGRINGRNYRRMLLDYVGKELPYQCEIIRRNGRYYCNITMEEAGPEKIFTCHNGVIGIDTNPDGIALTEVAADGNFKGSIWIGNGELTTARTEKKTNIIGEVVREALEQAKKSGKGIAVEDLKFADDKDVKSKFARVRHQFIYKKLILAIIRLAIREGVEVLTVRPQYTSTIGQYKYMHMFGLTVHQSAAYVIGRRALGYRDKVPRMLIDHLDDKSKQKFATKINEWSKWLAVRNYYKKKGGEYPGLWQSKRKEILGLGIPF